MPGGVHDVQERPRKVRDERVDGTNAPSRDTGPGGRLEVQEESKGAEVGRDRQMVVKGARRDRKHPRSVEDECDLERTRYVELEGREVIEARRRHREASRTIGGAITMATESDTMENGAG